MTVNEIPRRLDFASVVPSRSRLRTGFRTKARGRLKTLTILFAGIGLVAFALDTISGGVCPVITGAHLATVVLSTALYVVCRMERLTHDLVLRLGLLYEVLLCLVVSIGVNRGAYLETGAPPFVTWASILVVIFPMLVPTPPLRGTIASFAAASMVPLSVLLLSAAGAAPVKALHYTHVAITPFLCAGLAVACSYVIHGLRMSVIRAKQMGSYELIEMLGKGGMGEVWRAKHQMLARPAAVKLFRIGGSSDTEHDDLLKRFELEAQATALLQSPHTIDVYDFGVSDGGALYYVMELLDGLDLETLIKEHGPQPSERAVNILRQACHSLEEAHQAGLVHRDIKPANLFLCRYGIESDFLKILDFGIAKALDVGKGAGLTHSGMMVGTPSYMPPEMASSQGELDGRSDLYSLGCVAYWLLTGSLVFEARTAFTALMSHSQTAPPALSARIDSKIPKDLEHIVLACLQKDPAERPASASVLSAMLADVRLEHPWTAARAARWWDDREAAKGQDGGPIRPGEVGKEAATVPLQRAK